MHLGLWVPIAGAVLPSSVPAGLWSLPLCLQPSLSQVVT